jgi:glycogen operon protein
MTLDELLRYQRFDWYGVSLNQPDWGYDARSLAATVYLHTYRSTLHLMINAYWEPLDFEVPPRETASEAWRVRVDTYADPPHDVYESAEAPIVEGATFRVQPRSIVMLLSQSTNS